MRLTVSSLARRLFGRAPFAAELEYDSLVLTTRDGDLRLARPDVRRVVGTTGWLWDTLRVEPATGPTLVLRGLRRGSAIPGALTWHAWGLAPLAGVTARAFQYLLDRDAYCNRTAWAEWRARVERWAWSIPATLDDLPLPAEIRRDIAECRDHFANGERIVAARNDAWVRRKKQEHASWFARAGGKYGLTDEQQEAILRDEDNCLVVAGAGTGKTSTVAGKVGYLLRTGDARPEQVLRSPSCCRQRPRGAS